MPITTRTLVALVATLTLVGAGGVAAGTPAPTAVARAETGAAAYGAGPELAPRVLARTPWVKDDVVGEAARPEGDLRRIIVENSRTTMRFTWRTVATPLWDTPATERTTGMVFVMDWRGTTTPPNRILVVAKDDGVWKAAILNGNGGVVCTRQGGVAVLANHGFRIGAPVQQCLGGAHVLRSGGYFSDDQDDTAVEDVADDPAPNGFVYGPFIALPRSTRAAFESGTVGGWTVH